MIKIKNMFILTNTLTDIRYLIKRTKRRMRPKRKKMFEMEKKSFWCQIKSIYQTLEDSLTAHKKEKLVFK